MHDAPFGMKERNLAKRLLREVWADLKRHPWQPRGWYYFTLGTAAYGLATAIRFLFGAPR